MSLIEKGRKKSPWIYHLNTGSCNGCDIEIMALLGPKYDAERFGVKLAASPKHADIVLITGPVTTQCRERMIKCVVSSARTKSYSIGRVMPGFRQRI